MISATPAHDFLKQRLAALVAEATTHGIARDLAVAVLTDLITAPEFNDAAPDPMADSEPRPPKAAGPPNEVLLVSEKNMLLEAIVNPTGYV